VEDDAAGVELRSPASLTMDFSSCGSAPAGKKSPWKPNVGPKKGKQFPNPKKRIAKQRRSETEAKAGTKGMAETGVEE
jgi:hypothetical protein